MSTLLPILLCVVLLASSGCTEQPPQQNEPASSPDSVSDSSTEPLSEPPTPPVYEDFQGRPQLSLFPRVGDYQPAQTDERHPYWVTFIDHLVKTSGLVESRSDDNRAWGFRSVNTIDSLGYFAPLAVKPGTRYQVSFKLMAELPDGAFAGVGVLEFNDFLWVGEQYTEQLFHDHYRGFHEGLRLAGQHDWTEHDLTFTTGPDTRMIHIILFREGTHDRSLLLFDDLRIEAAESPEHH